MQMMFDPSLYHVGVGISYVSAEGLIMTVTHKTKTHYIATHTCTVTGAEQIIVYNEFGDAEGADDRLVAEYIAPKKIRYDSITEKVQTDDVDDENYAGTLFIDIEYFHEAIMAIRFAAQQLREGSRAKAEVILDTCIACLEKEEAI